MNIISLALSNLYPIYEGKSLEAFPSIEANSREYGELSLAFSSSVKYGLPSIILKPKESTV